MHALDMSTYFEDNTQNQGVRLNARAQQRGKKGWLSLLMLVGVSV